MAQTRMSVQDALWLTMDRPNNLMVVDVAVVLEGEPPHDAVRESLRDLVARHPVFGRKAVRRGTSWYWVDDPDFDLAQHVTFVALDEVADLSALQRLVASRRGQPLDRSHPLWSVALVGPIRLDDGSLGTAMAARFHHAIADGVRLTQVMVSLLQGDVKGSVPAIARSGAAGGSLVSVHGMRASASEAVHVAVSATQAVAGSVGHAVADPLGTAASAASAVAGGFELVRHPDRFVDALEVLGIADHRSINDVASVAKLLLSESDRTVWTGEPGTLKAVAWSPPMPLAEVKRVARARAVTVNDVLVSAVAGALRGYLREQGESADEVTWMVPVNLRPYNQDLPTDLGNYFALVMLPMPLHHDEPEARLAEVHHRMQRI